DGRRSQGEAVQSGGLLRQAANQIAFRRPLRPVLVVELPPELMDPLRVQELRDFRVGPTRGRRSGEIARRRRECYGHHDHPWSEGGEVIALCWAGSHRE